jgi:hypothetical protein
MSGYSRSFIPVAPARDKLKFHSTLPVSQWVFEANSDCQIGDNMAGWSGRVLSLGPGSRSASVEALVSFWPKIGDRKAIEQLR